MALVHIRIHGHDYALACDNGEEEHLRLLADEVDDRVRALIFRMGGNPGESMALLLAALTMADDILENKREIERLSSDLRRIGTTGDPSASMEAAMAVTLEDIAARIEKIAERIEMR